MTLAEATAAVAAIDKFLRFAAAAAAALDAGMDQRQALTEAEIASGVGRHELPTFNKVDLRALLENAAEAVDLDPEQLDVARRLLPGWH